MSRRQSPDLKFSRPGPIAHGTALLLESIVRLRCGSTHTGIGKAFVPVGRGRWPVCFYLPAFLPAKDQSARLDWRSGQGDDRSLREAVVNVAMCHYMNARMAHSLLTTRQSE